MGEDLDKKLWAKVVEFHGHACPGLAMGFRAVLAGLRRLGVVPAADEELVAVAETDACGVDAVQMISGCTVGKGNLILENRGKQAFTLFHRREQRGVRVYVDADAIGVGREDREARMRAILTRPEEEFCRVTEVRFAPPEEARIFPSAVCTSCGERVAEPWARLRDGKVVCLGCAVHYSRGEW